MTSRSRLRSIVEDGAGRSGRLFIVFIQGLILLSVVSLSIETLPDLPDSARSLLWRFQR